MEREGRWGDCGKANREQIERRCRRVGRERGELAFPLPHSLTRPLGLSTTTVPNSTEKSLTSTRPCPHLFASLSTIPVAVITLSPPPTPAPKNPNSTCTYTNVSNLVLAGSVSTVAST